MSNYKINLSHAEILIKCDEIAKKYQFIHDLFANGLVNCTHRHYGRSLTYTFHIAELCGYDEFDIIEFGVGPVPNGLIDFKNLINIIQEQAKTNFKVNIFGFDRNEGMPAPSSYKDHPEIWNEKLWGIEPLTHINAPFAKIYDGDLDSMIKEYSNNLYKTSSKIGFISFDLDQYQGTKIATEILKIDSKFLFPCLPMYWDDLYDTPLMSEFSGPGLALDEFNQENSLRKIDTKKFAIGTTAFLQVLDHPMRTQQEKPLYPLYLRNF